MLKMLSIIRSAYFVVFFIILKIVFVKCSSIFNPPTAMAFIETKHIGPCDDTGTKEIDFDLHVARRNRKDLVMYGNISNTIPVDNEVSIRLVLDVWGNGGWKKNFFVFQRTNACQGLKDLLGKCWEEFLTEKCKVNLQQPCAIPLGNYTCGDISTHYFNKCLSNLIPGKYRTDLVFIKNNKKKGCFQFITDTYERNVKREKILAK